MTRPGLPGAPVALALLLTLAPISAFTLLVPATASTQQSVPAGAIPYDLRNLPTILGHEAHGFREVFSEGRIHRPNPYPLR